MNLVATIARKIRLMIGTSILKLVDDTTGLQLLQITKLENEVRAKVNRIQNYAFTSVPLSGAQAVAATVGGNRDHVVVIACDDARYRKKGLQAGEAAMYHHQGDYILLKNGRVIEVLSGSKVKVTAPEVEVVASTKVKLQTPLCEISGALQVQGNITSAAVVSGATVTGGSVTTTAGRNLDTLRVTGVQTGSGTSGTPV